MKRKWISKLLLAGIALMTITACSNDNYNGNDTPASTDVINYKILSQDQAVAVFVNEPLHSQLTPLFLDIAQERKGVNYEDWLQLAKNSILAPTDEKQYFLDSIAVAQTAVLKSLGLRLPIDKETKYIDMRMLPFGNMLAFTSATRVYVDMERLIAYERYSPGYASMVMWHEMWHVISRNNPELRKQMYKLIGFNVLPNEIDIPDDVKSHILCNPDVERHDSYATFTIHGKPTDCMLMLYTPASEYVEGTTLDDYVSGSDGYWLLALDSATHKPYKGENGKWVMYNCTEASDFDEVMSGGNTSYCDDPEECMADNFSFAMMGFTTCPNPKLLKDIIATLLKYNTNAR